MKAPKGWSPNSIDRFAQANLVAAKIIAAEPERYRGGLLEWARLILSRAKQQERTELFESEAA